MAVHGGATRPAAGGDAAVATRGNVSRSVGRAGYGGRGKAEPAIQPRRFVCDSGRVAASAPDAERTSARDGRFVCDSGCVAASALDADQALAALVPGGARATEDRSAAVRARAGVAPRGAGDCAGRREVVRAIARASSGKRRFSWC